jgi:hypothetical protein
METSSAAATAASAALEAAAAPAAELPTLRTALSKILCALALIDATKCSATLRPLHVGARCHTAAALWPLDVWPRSSTARVAWTIGESALCGPTIGTVSRI